MWGETASSGQSLPLEQETPGRGGGGISQHRFPGNLLGSDNKTPPAHQVHGADSLLMNSFWLGGQWGHSRAKAVLGQVCATTCWGHSLGFAETESGPLG